ncbi:MAG: TetR/AcrR family transcriptional regulator [Intestinibaculum porci]|uniref:TetR/AcrR family transcriptional regulator n=1 Tax=Intestinibaculum porci TaxID=2487118 RepID=UPI003F0B1CDF
MDLKEKIIQAALVVYKQKGLKFTMDDVAKEMSVSKKTIYQVIDDKKALVNDLVDYCFASIKEKEEEVTNDLSHTTLERIEMILAAMPESFLQMDMTGLYVLQDKYPSAYRKVQYYLESGWEMTFDLLRQGIDEGVIRDINLNLFQIIYTSTLENFFKRDVLVEAHLDYMDALNQMVDILMKGIEK